MNVDTRGMSDEAKRQYNNEAAARYRKRHPDRSKAAVKAWRERNKDRWAEYLSQYEKDNREQRLEYRSNLVKNNRDKYTVMRHRRGGLVGDVTPRPEACDCCGGPPAGKHKVLQLDHCHSTNRFRGWLCNYCNVALGLIKDCPNRARKLADYLEKTS